MKNTLNYNSQKAFKIFVLLVWIQTILMSYIRAVIMRIPLIGNYPDALIALVYITLIVISLKTIRIHKKDILIMLFVVLCFILQWIFYQDRADYLDRYSADFLLGILPLYFVGTSMGFSGERDGIIRQMYLLSIITIIASIIYRYLFGTPMEEIASLYEGSMDLAYKLLPHCCLVAFYAIKRTNIVNVALTVIGGIYLLMLGTRGAALLYLILIALLFIIGNRSKWFIARIVAVFGGITVFISSSWYDAAILWFYQKAQQLGLSVRIFDKLLSGSASQSSGRDVIREKLFAAIRENPFFGHGLCSDRIIANSYAHNVAIELWVEFGVVIGSILLLACIVILFKGYLGADSDEMKGLVLALIFSCFLKLFLSGSYLDERLLFFLLGLCVANMRRKKDVKETAYEETL